MRASALLRRNISVAECNKGEKMEDNIKTALQSLIDYCLDRREFNDMLYQLAEEDNEVEEFFNHNDPKGWEDLPESIQKKCFGVYPDAILLKKWLMMHCAT